MREAAPGPRRGSTEVVLDLVFVFFPSSSSSSSLEEDLVGLLEDVSSSSSDDDEVEDFSSVVVVVDDSSLSELEVSSSSVKYHLVSRASCNTTSPVQVATHVA